MFATENAWTASAPGVAKTWASHGIAAVLLIPPSSTTAPGSAAVMASWAALSIHAYCWGVPVKNAVVSGSFHTSQSWITASAWATICPIIAP